MSEARTYRRYPIGITIRHTQVKKEVCLADLNKAVRQLQTVLPDLKILDIGTHINGKWRQLHFHVLAHGFNPIKYIAPYYYHSEVVRSVAGYRHYIHTDDHDNPYKKEQVLIENYSNHHYMFI